MAQTIDTHVVEIPVDNQNNQQMLIADPSSSPIDHHPLTEISESPGHLLLLKLYQRDEDLIANRIGLKESRLDSIKRQAFNLCSLFFAFHGLFLTLLFTTSILQSQEERNACKNWWVPSCSSLLTSLVLIFSVQAKVSEYWRVSRKLNKERNDERALTRCTLELRMKGASFDLSKEPQVSKRMKSSSVEIEWQLVRWVSQNLVTICLLCFAGFVAPASKFILCG